MNLSELQFPPYTQFGGCCTSYSEAIGGAEYSWDRTRSNGSVNRKRVAGNVADSVVYVIWTSPR